MQKPIEIIFEEFNTSLVSLINNSGLPPFVVSQSLRAALMEVDTIAKQHYEQAQQKYMENGQDGEVNNG